MSGSGWTSERRVGLLHLRRISGSAPDCEEKHASSHSVCNILITMVTWLQCALSMLVGAQAVHVTYVWKVKYLSVWIYYYNSVALNLTTSPLPENLTALVMEIYHPRSCIALWGWGLSATLQFLHPCSHLLHKSLPPSLWRGSVA